MPYSNLGSFRRAVRQENKPDNIMQYRKRKIDATQYERWTNILGKENMPQSLEKFQDMKYNNNIKFIELQTKKNDKQIQSKILDGQYNTALDEGKQGKHIVGHNNCKQGNSQLFIDYNEIKNMLIKKAGTGELLKDKSSKWNNKELIQMDKVIGIVNDMDGNPVKASCIIIHYSKTGVHIVPTLRRGKDDGDRTK